MQARRADRTERRHVYRPSGALPLFEMIQGLRARSAERRRRSSERRRCEQKVARGKREARSPWIVKKNNAGPEGRQNGAARMSIAPHRNTGF
jgi:hypothetical protein